jgi:uncharacterized protein YfeS
MKTIFLPPGVQANLFEKHGTYPRQLPDWPATLIEELWEERNIAPEEEIDRIDRHMERIVTNVINKEKIDVKQ